jgi:hypothetical protein
MRTILFITFFTLLPVSVLLAQNDTQTDRDAAIKESIEAQKRAAIDERRTRDLPHSDQYSRNDSISLARDYDELDSLRREAWADVQRAWEEASKTSQEAMREYGDVFQQAIEMARENYDENGGYSRFYSSFGMGSGGDFFFNEPERTTWELSKTMVEDSFSSDYTFDVDADASTLILSVSGDCRAGEIKISIITPSGSSYANLSIDEFGNLNWRKTFDLSVNNDKIGKWIFIIETEGSTGHLRISAQTF